MRKIIVNILILALALCFCTYPTDEIGVNTFETSKVTEAKTSEILGLNKLSTEDFNSECAKMIQNQTCDETSDFPYARLLAQTNADVDFSQLEGLTGLAVDLTGFAALQFENADYAREAFGVLENMPGVDFVEADQKVEAAGDVELLGEENQSDSTEESMEYNSWGALQMGFDKAVEKAKKSNKELGVAIVDTGVDITHPFLKDRCVSEGVNLFDSSKPQVDGDGHGTHVAGIVADCTRGSSGVKILPVKVLDDVGCGTDLTVIEGIKYAIEHKAKVINMSLSFKESRALDEAVRDAVSKGVTVVAASGNSYGPVVISSPSCEREAITVASLDDFENRSFYSSTSPFVDVAAPGRNILSSVPGEKFERMSGTSMATPHISAFVALMLQIYPEMTPNQVQTALKGCCNDLGDLGPDIKTGYGIPNFDNLFAEDHSYRWKGFETKHSWNLYFDETFKYEAYKSDTGYIKCTFDEVDLGKDGCINIYNGSGKNIGTYYGTELSGKTVTGKGNNFTIKVASNNDKKIKGFKVKTITEIDKNTHITFDSGVKKINKAAGKKVKMPAAKDKTIKVSFDACGGACDVKSVKKKVAFKGWAKSQGATAVKYKAGKSYSVSGTFNLYGVFKDEKIGKLPVAKKEGMKFLGWFTVKDGGKKVTKNSTFTKNTKLYAHYEEVR